LEYLEKVVEETLKTNPDDKFVITIYVDESKEDPTHPLTTEEIEKLVEFKKKLEENGHVVNIISVLEPRTPTEEIVDTLNEPEYK